MRYLITAFVVALFIPKSVNIEIGVLQFTPLKVLGIILFPILVFGGHIRWRWPDLLMPTIFLYGLVLYLYDDPIGTSLERFGRGFLEGGMAYLVGRYMAQDYQRFIRNLRLIVLLLSIFAVGLVIEALFRFNIHQSFWGVLFQTHDVYGETRLGFMRAMGWTVHPIMLGLTYAAFFSVTLHAALSRSNMVGKRPWVKVGLLGLGAFVSASSGVYATIVIVICMAAWDRLAKAKPVYKWGIALIGIPIGYFVLEMFSNRSLMRILMMKVHITSDTAWFYRWRLYRRVMEAMPGHWWFGYGSEVPGAFQGAAGSSIDNQYLLLLLTEGLVGLGLWIGVMLAVLFYAGRSVWFGGETPMARFARAVGFTIIAFIAAQFTVAVFSRAATLLWLNFGLMLSLGALCAEQARRPKRRRAKAKRPASSRPGPDPASNPPPRQGGPQPA